MGGFGFNSILKGAKDVVKEVEEHPADLLAGPAGLAIAYGQSRGGLRGIEGALGIRQRSGVGKKSPPSLPKHKPSAAPLLLAAGATPYTFTGYTQIAASTAVVAKTKIADMFTSAITPQFNANNKFPNTFHAYRMRWSVGLATAAPTTSKESIQWARSLYVVFKNQTEVARVSLEELGVDFASTASLTTSGGAQAFWFDANAGIPWNVVYDSNASYAMEVTSDFAIASTAAIIEFQYSLDGVLYQGTDVNEEEVAAAIVEMLAA